MTLISPQGDMFALNADRYQIYPASPFGPFVLGKALQSQEFSFEIPNEAVLEIGNEEQRGVLIRSAQFAGTMSSLLVDTDLIQLYSSKMGSIDEIEDSVGTSFSGNEKTIAHVVSPVNFSVGTPSGVFTLEAVSEDEVIVSGVNHTPVKVDEIIRPMDGVEIAVLNSGELVVGDQIEVTISKETSWDAADFKGATVDFLVVARDNSTSDNVFKTDYVDAMIAQNLNIETSAEGMAQISFDNEGNTYISHQGYVLRRAVYAVQGDVDNGFIDLDDKILEGTEAPHIGSTGGKYRGKYFLKVTKTTLAGDQTVMTEVDTNAVAGDFTYTNATKVITPHTAIALGDRYEFTFFTLASDEVYDIDFSHTGTPDVIDGRYVPVNYGNTKLETVESANISIAFNRERKARQGFVDDYFTPAKVPVVTGDVASMDGDLKLVKLLTKGSISTDQVQFDYNEHGTYTNTNDVPFYIQILDPADSTVEIVKFTVDKVQLTGSSIPIAVGSDTGRSFGWTAKDGSVKITRG